MSTKELAKQLLSCIDDDLVHLREIVRKRESQREAVISVLEDEGEAGFGADIVSVGKDGTMIAIQAKTTIAEVIRARDLPDLVYQMLLRQLPKGMYPVPLFKALKASGAPISRRPYVYALLQNLAEKGLAFKTEKGEWFARSESSASAGKAESKVVTQ